ncbi:MAG: LamG-like jellyroll fold domain-containing protein [Armatimonadota bacterium]
MVTCLPGRTNGRSLVIALVTSVILTLLLVFGQLASASQLAPFRGASLTGPSYDWPFTTSKWDTAIWPNNKTAKDEVHEYMHRLESLGFNAIRCLLFCDAVIGLSWDSAMGSNLCEYIDMAADHHLKIYFYISLTNPSYDDDPGSDPNSNDGTTVSPCLLNKSDNTTLYNAVIAQAKTAIDNTVGYVDANRSASEAIIGWSVGFGEDPNTLSNIDFIKDMTTYVKQVDAYHPVGVEVKGQIVSNGQIVLLPNAPGHNDSYISARNVYSYLDFIGMANYDLCDGEYRSAITPWTPDFIDQVAAQNPDHKPVMLEEYGTNYPGSHESEYLVQRINSDTGPATDWQGTFIWDAHEWWDAAQPPNRWSLFGEDVNQPYYIGAEQRHTNTLFERFQSHAWASYTFDDKTSVGTGLDGQGYCDLTLYNGAYKYYAKTGYGLILDGTNDYAAAAYNLLMNQDHLCFEAWVKHTAQQLGCIASRNGCWTLLLGSDNKLHIWANTGSGWAAKLDSTGTISTNTWTRAAISYDGRYWRIYKDGTLDSSLEDVGSINTNTADLGIGITGGGTPYYFQGAIDEVQLCPIPGPLMRLKCDESSGSTLSDSSGNGLGGALYGGYDRTIAQALPDGYAINFNGSTGYATVANTYAKTTGSIGVDFWMYPQDTTPATLAYVISQGEQGAYGSGWGLYIWNGSLYFEMFTNTDGDGHDVVVSKSIPAENQWYHVRADYEGTTARLSIDGNTSTVIPSSQYDGPIVYQNSENVTLGRLAYPSGYYYFDGALDEVQIHSTAFEAPW